MSALGKILLYLVVVVLLAASLSPCFYWLIQWLGDQGILTSLAKHPFHRFFSRTAQVTAFILLVPMLWWLGIRRVSEFGLEKNVRWGRHLLLGFLIALIPVIILGAVYIGLDAYRIRKDLAISGLGRIVLTAGVVSILEEFLFRGVLLGLAARAFGAWRAIVGVSVVFALVHFLKAAKAPVEHVHWYSGFQEITAVFVGFPAWPIFILGFLSLLVAGLILGYATLKTRSLWLAIGLHAGWIMAQQGLQWLAKFRAKPPEELLPWVGPNLVNGAVPTGLAPLAILLLTGLVIWYYLRSCGAKKF